MTADLPALLLVDDDANIREMLELLVEEWGYHATLAATATEGLKHLLEHRFDVIILDNWLPDLDGIELCRQIREFDKKTPIVFFSAAVMGSEDRAALLAGANRYISKGIGLSSLREALEEEIDKTRKHPGNQKAHRQ